MGEKVSNECASCPCLILVKELTESMGKDKSKSAEYWERNK